MHLDRYLSKYAGLSRKSILRLLYLGQIKVDEEITFSRDHPVSNFSKIHIEGKLLNLHKPARYFLMNKPAGILSATIDPQHTTAIELMAETDREDLHIAGRLDRATTGLLILTNDGKWSRHITEPDQKIPKTYRVETQYAIAPQTADLFSKGIYFAYEDITTSPAEIEILNPTTCLLTIYEGRYHQVKRMFAATGNRVKNLHRESVGQIKLDSALRPGEYRALSQSEIDSIWQKSPIRSK